MWFRRKRNRPPPEANVIRMPATGCPQGWIRVPELFVDRDGNVSDGCALPGIPPLYDEKGLLVKVGTPFFFKPLAPGETMRLQLVVKAWADWAHEKARGANA